MNAWTQAPSKQIRVDVFLGPVEAYVLAPVARFSGAWNVPLLTPGGQPNAFDTRKDYPLLTRLKGFYTEVGELFSSVVKQWDWKVLGLLYEDTDESRGKSVCHFTLESIYTSFTQKPHHERFEPKISNFTQLLMKFHDKARSKYPVK
ncbi:atrial natriuretic peptide receptor 3-like isoform X2 [Scylla paramamosain]|uniref:atrial natriuretic peptide receptor 3-like isoform X2 n=1 Tax=Scylla paramamosain TaxID=85552 RepID=UPI003082B525